MGKIAEFFGFKKKPQEETRSATGLQFQTLLPGSTNFNASQAMTLPVVYRCIQCISEAVAQLPIQVFHIDDDGNRAIAYGFSISVSTESVRRVYLLMKSKQ